MNELTIFTPTYNRKDTIERLYNSLVSTNKKINWLVIDDGSTDDTESLINKFIKEKKINIKYLKKENGGKMSAFNMAIEKCDTKYFMTIDSDDMLAPNFLDKLKKDLDTLANNDKLIGLVYLTANMNHPDKIIGSSFPGELICKYYEIYNKYHVTGDKSIVWKSKLLKEFSYPIIKGEKFIPDIYLMNEASVKYDFMTINHIATLVEYQNNGYSSNYFDLVKRNPLGNILYFKQLYTIKKSFYNVYGYILFSIYAKKRFKDILKNHPAKLKVLILYIPTWVLSKIK